MSQAIALLDHAPDRDLPVVRATQPERHAITVPLLLAAGWSALFTFSLAFLADDGRPDAARDERSRAAASAGAFVADPLPPGAAASADPFRAATEAAAAHRFEEPAAPSESWDERTVASARRTPPSSEPGPARPAFVGTWGPNARACGRRPQRRGFLPALITENGAKAGGTRCRFRDPRREGEAWTTLADCTSGPRRWTSQVRLLVRGDALNWSSEKGTAVYVRCGRREG